MSQTPDSKEIVAALRALKPRLQEEFGITRLRVFGSVARGEAGPDSDVDLLVDFEKPIGLFQFWDIQDYIKDEIGRDIDLLTEEGIDKYIKKRVMREATDVS